MWMDVTVKGLVWCPFQGLSIVPADAIVVRQDKALNKKKRKRINYIDIFFFEEIRFVTFWFVEMTLYSQIYKIINTLPLFLFFFVNFFN